MEFKDTPTTIFNHNLWANLRLLKQCETLSQEQLETAVTGTFGSILDTFQHIALAEKSYFSRISTGERYHSPKGTKLWTIDELMDHMQETGEGLIEWAQEVSPDETVLIDWDGTPREVPKTILLTQAVNHATEHRAQIMVIMTQLGIQPQSLDCWTYFNEMERED